jgi:2-amino-4-hydroxy-6-hydroxymethyldihydropteridine diphosphokinase
MATAYIGFGSNLGESQDICHKAISLLDETEEMEVEVVSSFFQTEPVGFETQPPFINGAVRVRTSLGPEELFSQMRRIEQELGRVTKFKWGPRYIDLDLLLFDDLVLESQQLTVPHPLMNERRFVLMPLAEIAPEVRHPILGKTIAELLIMLDDEKKVELVK